VRDTLRVTEPAEMEIGAKGLRLGQLLKWAGLVPSGGAVKELLESGAVLVNGTVETRRGAQLKPGDTVTCGTEVVRLK